MITIPLPTIIEKIKAATNLTEEEIKQRIKAKLEELSGLISEEGAAHIVANELGVKLLEPAGELTIKDLLAGMRSVDIIGKVKNVYEVRNFSTERRSGKVGSIIIADTTGTIRVVLWNDQADAINDLTPGDTVKIKGAYVRNNQGRLELHLGDNAKIYKNPEGVTVDIDISQPPPAQEKHIAELTEQDNNVAITATIVQVFDPRFFPACPECNARVREDNNTFTCPTHGTITPTYNYVMNLYLDDGTDNIRCVLWREQVDALLGKTREEVLSFKDNPSLFEPHKTEMLGMIIKARGRVQKNENFGRLEFIAYNVEPRPQPPAGEQLASQAQTANTITETTTATATLTDEGTVENITVKEETTMSKEPVNDEELLTLEDIEDLEDLDDAP